MDWNKIKKEYIRGGTSYRKLSEKYGVSLRTLTSRAGAEGWVRLREQACSKTVAKTVEDVAAKNAKIKISIDDSALALLAAFNASVEAMNGDPMPASMLRDYASALKGIQVVLDKPTDLDMKEQEARIAKLRKEAEKDDNQAGGIVITLEGDGDYDG